jgi:hypothetical protein
MIDIFRNGFRQLAFRHFAERESDVDRVHGVFLGVPSDFEAPEP